MHASIVAVMREMYIIMVCASHADTALKRPRFSSFSDNAPFTARFTSTRHGTASIASRPHLTEKRVQRVLQLHGHTLQRCIIASYHASASTLRPMNTRHKSRHAHNATLTAPWHLTYASTHSCTANPLPMLLSGAQRRHNVMAPHLKSLLGALRAQQLQGQRLVLAVDLSRCQLQHPVKHEVWSDMLRTDISGIQLVAAAVPPKALP